MKRNEKLNLSFTESLIEVRPEDFDVKNLRRAASEGRLFLIPEASGAAVPVADAAAAGAADALDAAASGAADGAAARSVGLIMEYVERIAPYATLPAIRQVWQEMLSHERLAPLFFLGGRYKAKRGQVNWYRVTEAVCVLHNLGAYTEDKNNVQLHLLLEGTTQRTSRYSGRTKYCFAHSEIRLIQEILASHRP